MLEFAVRTAIGIASDDLEPWAAEIHEYLQLGLLAESGDRVVLTRRGKLLADQVAAIFV